MYGSLRMHLNGRLHRLKTSGRAILRLAVALELCVFALVSDAQGQTIRYVDKPRDDDFVIEKRFTESGYVDRVVNQNVSNLAGNEAEMAIAINPTDPQNIVIACHSPAFTTMDTYYTTNGGGTWSRVTIGQPQDGLATNFRFDPSVQFDRSGNVFVAYGAGGTGAGITRRLMVCRSTDKGATYGQFTSIVTPDNSLDKWIINTGPDPTTTSRDNIYVAYRISVGADVQLRLAASLDGGATWPTNTTVNDDATSGSSFSTFGMPAVGPNGRLYVVWDDESAQPASSTVKIDVSTDAGVTFGTDQTVGTTTVARGNANGFTPSGSTRYHIKPQPDRGILTVPSIAVDRSGGIFNGRIYVTYTIRGVNGGTDNTDVVCAYSSNINGATNSWNRVTINNDATTRSQFLPWVTVDQTSGIVSAAWLDARQDANNEKVECYVGDSRDGGVTWRNIKAARGQSNQSTSNPSRSTNNYLEYMGAASMLQVTRPAWPDSSVVAGNLEVYSDGVSNETVVLPGPVRYFETYAGMNDAPLVTFDVADFVDWAHYGRTDTNRFNHYGILLDFISDRSHIGGGFERQSNSGRHLFSWTNGAPTVNGVNERGHLWVPGSNNEGYEFTAVSATSRRELRIWVGAFGSGMDLKNLTARLEAQLQRNVNSVWTDLFATSVSEELSVSATNQNRGGYYSVRIGPTANDQRVRIRVIAKSEGAPNSNLRFAAAGLLENPANATGDANCDGLVNLLDVEAFNVALLNSTYYDVNYGPCSIFNCDMNGDGKVDGLDIRMFIKKLVP
ncbi:MAG: hypothetical protein HZA51_16060 [Planctomycetes bacterium]|nr:hypothetical protein [Planctomycetota bacterium]